jgi:hypothetical protein
MMTMRFCPTCAAEVQDAGGFCMLGHRLRPEVSGDPLRDDLDSLFEGLAAEIESASRPAPTRPAPSAPPPPPPPPAMKQVQTVWDDLDTKALTANDPITSFAPAPRMDWGPDRSVMSRLEGLFNRPQRPSRASA